MQTEELRSHLEHVAGEIRVDTASAWLTVRERATRRRRHARIATGVALGIVGVALIAGIAPAGDLGETVGTLAVILASLFYASAGIYGQLRLHGTTSGPVLATGNMLAAGLILLPFAVVQHPTSMPTTGALGSLVLLDGLRRGR